MSITAVIHERGRRGKLRRRQEGQGPSSDDNPHACGAAARKGPSPITKACPSQINYSGISAGAGKKRLTLDKTQILAGCLVLVKVPRFDPGGKQRVTLQVERLTAVGLGDAHIADQHRLLCKRVIM